LKRKYFLWRSANAMAFFRTVYALAKMDCGFVRINPQSDLAPEVQVKSPSLLRTKDRAPEIQNH